VKNDVNEAVVRRTLHDVVVEMDRLLGIAQELYNKAMADKRRQDGKSGRAKRNVHKLVSAKLAMEHLVALCESKGRQLPAYLKQHGGSWSAHVTFVRALSPLAVDAIGVTAGARAWDFIANLVEVWWRVPEAVADALAEQDEEVAPGQEDARDALIKQEHMDEFMAENKLYSVWNKGKNSLSVSRVPFFFFFFAVRSPYERCLIARVRVTASAAGQGGVRVDVPLPRSSPT
jgi:hypothetical protein